MMSNDRVISVADIHAAAQRIRGIAVRTPLLEYAALNEFVGQRVLVKFEGLQHTGSFKFRGAFNKLTAIAPSERRKGVVAWSSGNHAQGVATALGMAACAQGRKVRCFRVTELITQRLEAREERLLFVTGKR